VRFKYMTLILAATNGKEIVVGADSLVHERALIGENAYRGYTAQKLRVINNGRWIVAFTGLGGAATNLFEYLEATDQTFDPNTRIGIMECTRRIGEVVSEFRLTVTATALLAGFSGPEPMIYSWSVTGPDPDGGSSPKSRGIGSGSGLGVFVLDMCQPFEGLSTEQLISAVYFGISEVMRAGEPRIRKPIDIGIVRPDGAEILDRASLVSYEEKSAHLVRLFRENL
jgi:hypothetical protein